MVSIAYGQGRIQSGRMRGRPMHASTSHFQKRFLMHTIFLHIRTSSIAISLTPSERIVTNVRTKCIKLGEALEIRVKKFK